MPAKLALMNSMTLILPFPALVRLPSCRNDQKALKLFPIVRSRDRDARNQRPLLGGAHPLGSDLRAKHRLPPEITRLGAYFLGGVV